MTAQDQLIQKYGNPTPGSNYLAKYCMIWQVRKDFPWFPTSQFEINKDFHTLLFQAFTELQKEGLHTQIKTFDGCYNYRPSRTTRLLSLHSWAAAIDLNASTEALGQTHAGWTPQFIKVMTDAKIFWGGNFHHTKDPMHFALLDG